MSAGHTDDASRKGSDDLPTATVVIASHRGVATLGACLQGLAAQRYPSGRYDVVVVDDGSPEPLLAAELPVLEGVTVHRQENAGPAAARNAGVRLARGELVAFTDDDCVPDPDWLPALGRAYLEHPQALLGGAVINALPHDRYAAATESLEVFLSRAFGPGSTRQFFTSNNIAVSRDEFEEVGGFDESFPIPGGEDRELCERWQAQGRPLVRVPDAVVRHEHAMTLRSFLRRHANYGRGAYQVHTRRQVPDDAGAAPESVRFYARLVADPFTRLPARSALGHSALLVLAQAATVVGYLGERRRSRRSAHAGVQI